MAKIHAFSLSQILSAFLLAALLSHSGIAAANDNICIGQFRPTDLEIASGYVAPAERLKAANDDGKQYLKELADQILAGTANINYEEGSVIIQASFLDSAIEVLQADRKNQFARFTQDNVWHIHAMYSRIKSFKEKELQRSNRVSEFSLLQFKRALETFEKLLAETEFFELTVQRGFTLVPGVSDTPRYAINQKDLRPFTEAQTLFQFAVMKFKFVKDFDSFYPDNFRRDLLNGGMRRRMVEPFTEVLTKTSAFIEFVMKEYNRKTTNFDSVDEFIGKIEAIIDSRHFQNYMSKNENSYFRSTRNQTKLYRREELKFKTVVSSFTNSPRLKLVKTEAKIVVDTPAVDKFTSDIRDIIMENQGSISYSKYADAFEKFAEQVENKASFTTPELDIPKVLRVIDFAEVITEKILKKPGMFNGYSREEVEAANRIRASIEELRAKLQ